jgi:hypothetical protein
MSKSAVNLANELLGRSKASFEFLEIHQFEDNLAAHDDVAMEQLYSDFESQFEQAQSELSACYGEPSPTGDDDDEVIPINGVLRFAIWSVGGKLLYLATAHEDRELPILLMLGTALR